MKMTYHIASIASIPLILLAVALPPRRRGRPNQWGLDPNEVKNWVYQIVQEYPYKLTLRAVYYRLVATRGFPNVLGAYKWLLRWTKRWRLEDPWLKDKFIDYGRLPIVPKPLGINRIEVWAEKYSSLVLIQDILDRFRVPVQITRGYGSLSMFRDALRRAKKRGVKKIVYLGDIGPTGLDIERVTRKKMPVEVRKIALTWSQVRRYKLFPRFCKPKDRRSPAYIARYGNRAFDLESLDPKILREIVERELRKLIPPPYLRELERREEVERAAVELVRELLERGFSPEEIMRRLRRLRGKKRSDFKDFQVVSRV